MGFDHSERPQGSIYIIKKGYEKNVPDIPCIRQLRPQYNRQSKVSCPAEATR